MNDFDLKSTLIQVCNPFDVRYLYFRLQYFQRCNVLEKNFNHQFFDLILETLCTCTKANTCTEIGNTNWTHSTNIHLRNGNLRVLSFSFSLHLNSKLDPFHVSSKMPLASKQILTVVCRLAFAILALYVSIWIHTHHHDENALDIYMYMYKSRDGFLGGFWITAPTLFFIVASVVLEWNIVSSEMTRTFGGFTLYLIGTMLLFMSSIWFFVVPWMILNDDDDDSWNTPPKNMIQGCILTSGLITFIAQVIIVFQYRVSTIQNNSKNTFVSASIVGAFASFMIYLGGVFSLQEEKEEDVMINGIMSSLEPSPPSDSFNNDNVHVEAMHNRYSICLMVGCVSFLLNAILLASAFSSMSDKSIVSDPDTCTCTTEAVEVCIEQQQQQETAIPAEVVHVFYPSQ